MARRTGGAPTAPRPGQPVGGANEVQKKEKGEPQRNFFPICHDILESQVFRSLPICSQMLYVWLCKLRNRKGTKSKGVIQISDRELEEITGMSRPTITKAKKRLQIYGFISWKNSKRYGCRYSLRNTIEEVLK